MSKVLSRLRIPVFWPDPRRGGGGGNSDLGYIGSLNLWEADFFFCHVREECS